MTTTMQDVLYAISGMTRAELDLVMEACNARHKAVKATETLSAMTTLKVGDKVRLLGLSPKYANGATGFITVAHGPAMLVALEDNIVSAKARQRFGPVVTVPAGSLEKVG